MKLQDLAQKKNSKNIVKVMESYFDKAPAVNELSKSAANTMLTKVSRMLESVKKTTAIHQSEQDPKYLQLLMIEQALRAKLAEYAGAAPAAGAGAVTMAPSAPSLIPPGAKPSVQAGKVSASKLAGAAKDPAISQDPALKAMMDKAAKGEALDPKEAQVLAALAADSKLGESEGSSRRIIKRLGSKAKSTVIYKDSEWDEYIVRFFKNGVHQKDADYHTDDKGDALSTAETWVGERSHVIEDREYSIRYVDEDDMWSVVDSVGNQVESFIEKHEAAREARKLNAGATAPKSNRHVNYRQSVDEALPLVPVAAAALGRVSAAGNALTAEPVEEAGGSSENKYRVTYTRAGLEGERTQIYRTKSPVDAVETHMKFFGGSPTKIEVEESGSWRDITPHLDHSLRSSRAWGDPAAQTESKLTSKGILNMMKKDKLKEASTAKLVEFYRKNRGVAHESVKLVEAELKRRSRMVESAKNRSRKIVTEGDIQQAQVVLAAQDMVDQVQKMVEQASNTQFKDLPALVSQIRIDLGPDQSAQFNQSATAAFQGLLQSLQDTKNQLEGAVGIVTGSGGVVPPVGAPAADPAAMPGVDAAAADLDLDAETDDITGLGRERR